MTGRLGVVTGSNKPNLGGGFKDFLCSSLFGEDSYFDEHIFQMGWFNQQLETIGGFFG